MDPAFIGFSFRLASFLVGLRLNTQWLGGFQPSRISREPSFGHLESPFMRFKLLVEEVVEFLAKLQDTKLLAAVIQPHSASEPRPTASSS